MKIIGHFLLLIFGLNLLVTASIPCRGSASTQTLEVTGSASALKNVDADTRTGLGIHLRFKNFPGASRWGILVHLETLWHPLAPAFVVGGGLKSEGQFYFEIFGGAFVGVLANFGLGYSLMPGIGYQITESIFISVPFVYHYMRGPWMTTYMPYLGIRL